MSTQSVLCVLMFIGFRTISADTIDLTNAYRYQPDQPLPGSPTVGVTTALDVPENGQTPTTTTPLSFTFGFLVLLEGGNPQTAADRESNNWSDVVQFTQPVNQRYVVNLYSDLGEVGDLAVPADVVIAIANTSNNVVFALEAASGSSDYPATATVNGMKQTLTWRVQSDPSSELSPEPTPTALIFAGLCSIVLFKRASRRRPI